jgi:hypothetical protein
MRPVAIHTLLLCALAAPVRSEVAIGTNLTLLLDFEKAPPANTIREMQREVQQLLHRTGVRLDLRLRSEVAADQDYEDVVLLRFRGSCRASSLAPLLDERGPFAWSHTIEGLILPFADVACDNVRRAVEEALFGGEKARRDELFGRALGRIVAHELYHIIGGVHTHGKKGVAQAALSGRELIADRMTLEPEDARRMVEGFRARR